MTSSLWGFDQKNQLFCGGITLKFCTCLAKGLKIKVKNILVAKCYVCRIYRGKMEGSLFTNNNLSVFSRIRTEYWEILRISLYSVRMQENKNKKHSEQGHFSCIVCNAFSNIKWNSFSVSLTLEVGIRYISNLAKINYLYIFNNSGQGKNHSYYFHFFISTFAKYEFLCKLNLWSSI